MIRNYFKIAWRSLKKQPFFTFINIFGLSVGMAGALLISLYIFDELSFNRSFKDAERIHMLMLTLNLEVRLKNLEFW